MRTTIAPGAVIESVTEAELQGHLNHTIAQLFQEQARGVTPFRFDHTDTVGSVTSGAVRLPAIGEQEEGPRAGFLWQIGSIRWSGLATGDVLNVFRNSTDPRNFIGFMTFANPVFTFQKLTFFKGGEKIIVTGASLTATGDVTVNGEGVEASELDLFKLL
jgi:hypothetical protein